MKLLVVRHGKAENKKEFSLKNPDDRLRPLTKQGVEEFQDVARGLRQLCPEIELIITSPWRRAEQTAQLLNQQFPKITVEVCQALVPTTPFAELLTWLTRQNKDQIAICGHEPYLSHLIGWLTTGRQESFIQFKKGGAALIEFEETIREGRGRLQWLLKPSQLAKLT